MCLSGVDFALFYDKKEDDYVGIGYKVYDRDFLGLDSLNRQNSSKYPMIKLRTWIKATFSYFLERERDKTKFVHAIDGNDYHPGFHIFLNKKDARNYEPDDSCVVVEVMYKNVLAFGTQSVEEDCYGPCVIAGDMKILSIEKEEKDD